MNKVYIIGGQIRINMKVVLKFEMFAHHLSDKDEKIFSLLSPISSYAPAVVKRVKQGCKFGSKQICR